MVKPAKSWSGKWGSNKPYKSKGNWGSNNKPPKKGGLCITIAPHATWPALLMLGGVIVKSLVG
jgi:hypothetical protein